MAVPSVNPLIPTPNRDQVQSRGDSMDRADFLKMLVAQLKSQDPLNPMSNEDFAAQLATFTSLQELQNIGDILDQSLQSNLLLTRTFNNTMAASLIGRTITADANTINIGDRGESEITYNLSAPATDITLEIRNSSGQLVRTIKASSQAAGEHTLTWDGTNQTGEHVLAGQYTVTVVAKGTDGASVSATTTIRGRITGVEYEDGNVVLLIGKIRVGLGQVISILDNNPNDEGGA